jgi:hypothetical protein
MLLRHTGRLAALHDKEGAGSAGSGVPPKDDPPQGDGAKDGGDPPKTYTAEEVEAKLRGSGKEIERLKADLAKHEEAEKKRKAAEDKRKADEMTETERLKKAAEDALAGKLAAEQERDKIRSESLRRLAVTEAQAVMREHGPVDGDVLSLAPADALAHDESGALTPDAKKALDKWITTKTGSLFRGKGGGGQPGGADHGRGRDREPTRSGGKGGSTYNQEVLAWGRSQEGRRV